MKTFNFHDEIEENLQFYRSNRNNYKWDLMTIFYIVLDNGNTVSFGENRRALTQYKKRHGITSRTQLYDMFIPFPKN